MPEPALLLLLGVVALLAGGIILWPDHGLLQRWRARAARARVVLEQDALKQARLDELQGSATTAFSLAGRLGVSSRPMATLLAALETTGLVSQTGEQVRLTERGRDEGTRIIRAHRLWERHLADDTGFAESEWHAIAERQEHRLTPAEADALAQQLGQPASDPHGDPIPTSTGDVVLHQGQPLTSLSPGATARITHVEDEPADAYDQIVAAGLVAGTVVRLLAIGPDGVLLGANGDEHHLSARAANNIAVLPLPSGARIEALRGIPLHALRPGERGTVEGLSLRCRGAERRRMLDLGVLPGTAIEAVMTSPTGDPTAYRIRDALIALRREQAGLIRVTRHA